MAYENVHFQGYSMFKLPLNRAWAKNGGLYFRLLSLYYHYFLHFYPALEHKIKNNKKKQ